VRMAWSRLASEERAASSARLGSGVSKGPGKSRARRKSLEGGVGETVSAEKGFPRQRRALNGRCSTTRPPCRDPTNGNVEAGLFSPPLCIIEIRFKPIIV